MFARTERLTLRPGWIEDAPALLAAIGHEAVVRTCRARLGRTRWPMPKRSWPGGRAIPVRTS